MRELRHALRSLRATPAFTGVALAVLTLGIGATTAIFSVVDAVILRRLPFPESDRLVAVGEVNVKDGPGEWPGGSTSPLNRRVAPQNYLDWRDQQDVFTGLAAVGYAEIGLKRDGDVPPENLRAQRVTAEFLPVLRTAPALGRGFLPEDEREGAARVAVISHGLWQRRFGGRPDIVGARLPSQLATFEIVGVMPPGFTYPVDTYVIGTRESVDVWVPHIFARADRIRGNDFGYNLHVVGRLRDGVSLERAQARMDQITASLAAVTPRWFTDRVTRVEPLHELVTGSVRRWMVMLLAAVAFVLLIACVNLANLMLVRATTRTRELGIRSALGASRWDLSRVLLLESLLLSFSGAALGAAVAWWGVDLLRAILPDEVPRAATIAVDVRVLGVTAGVAILVGLALGLAPVLQFTRPTIARALTQSERTGTANTRTQGLRATLVVAEVALAVILLVGSGLFLASFARVTHVDLGMDYRDILAMRVRVLEAPKDPKAIQQVADRNRELLLSILDRVRGIPGVEVAALLGGGLPLRGDLQTVDFAIPGRVLPRGTDIDFNQISADYFRTVRVPLLKGRFFTNADYQSGQPVVILNQAAVARYFDGEDVIGQVVRLAGDRTVVGVVGNIRHDGPETGWRTQAFVPIAQSRIFGATLVVRTTPSAQRVGPVVRQTVWAALGAAALPVRVDEGALDQYFDRLVAERRFNMLLLALFGLLGLVIAAVGIYGVMSYVVAQRTQEIGIRMALGAPPSSILLSVLASATTQLSIGLALGVIGAWGLAGSIRGLLFDIQPHDPRVFAGALVVLATTGLAAAFVPARRAAAVDPIVALRIE